MADEATRSTAAGSHGDDPRPAATRPIDVDGVLATTVGSALWAVALVVAIALHSRLQRDGHLWWLACAACGFGLGLLGVVYTLRRRRRSVEGGLEH